MFGETIKESHIGVEAKATGKDQEQSVLWDSCFGSERQSRTTEGYELKRGISRFFPFDCSGFCVKPRSVKSLLKVQES